MVKECSHPVNGQGLANCPIALGWAQEPIKFDGLLGGPSYLENSYCF